MSRNQEVINHENNLTINVDAGLSLTMNALKSKGIFVVGIIDNTSGFKTPLNTAMAVKKVNNGIN